MEIILFTFSTIFFHLPLAILKDTIRRLDRMDKYNPEKADNYKINNNIPLEYGILSRHKLGSKTNPFSNDRLSIQAFFSGFLLALIPLFIMLHINWFLIIIINIIIVYLIMPFIVYFIYPINEIYNIEVLKIRSIVYFSLAIIFLLIGLLIK